MKKIFIGLVSLLLVTGCDFTKSNEDTLIYTTYYPTLYFTDYLYGKYSTIESIYPSEVDTSTYELTDKQKKLYSKSDLFIYTGVDKENDLATDLLNLNGELRIGDAAKRITYKKDISETWLNPSSALMMIRLIKTYITDYEDNLYNKNYVESQYEELKIDISNLDVELTLMGKNASRNTILVSDDTLNFLSKYNIKVLSVDKDSEDYTKNLNEAKALINSGDIKYIFKTTGSELNEEVTNIVNSYSLEELEIRTMYTLTEEERKNNEDYLSIMEENITKLKTELFR